MESIIQTNDILNELRCTNCLKYLSVLPIQVYPDNSINCGRCVDNDDGVPSLYNDLIENVYFKCINHYEGCTALLQPKGMADHEELCTSSVFKCPICKDVKLPVYAMENHFVKRHRKQILKEPTLSIKFKDDLEQYYYYGDHKDNIFIIKICYDGYTENLSVNCMHFGSKKKNVNITYHLYDESIKDDTKSVKYLCNNEFTDSNLFTNMVPKNSPCKLEVLVCETISLNTMELFKVKKIDLLYTKLETIPKSFNRIIHLSDEFIKEYPNWKLLPSKLILVNGEDLFITFQGFCYDCQFIRTYKNHTLKINVNICKFCYETNQALTKMYTKLNFYCKWNCKEYFNWHEILNHEMTCTKQSTIINCGYCAQTFLNPIDYMLHGEYNHNFFISFYDSSTFMVLNNYFQFESSQYISGDSDINTNYTTQLFEISPNMILNIIDSEKYAENSYIKLMPDNK